MKKTNNLRTKHSWTFGLAYYFTLAEIQSGLNLEKHGTISIIILVLVFAFSVLIIGVGLQLIFSYINILSTLSHISKNKR